MPMWSSFWRNLATGPCQHEAVVGNKPKKSWPYRLTSSQRDNPERTAVTRTNQTLSFGKFECESQEGIHDFPSGPAVKGPPANAGDMVQSLVWRPHRQWSG